MQKRIRFAYLLLLLLFPLSGCDTASHPAVVLDGTTLNLYQERMARMGFANGVQQSLDANHLPLRAYSTGTDQRSFIFNTDDSHLATAQLFFTDDDFKANLKKLGFDEALVTNEEGKVLATLIVRPAGKVNH